MRTFFSSDHHFDHRNVIKYCQRPWDSVEEMNAGLADLWNETVQPGDTVLYLGDFSLSKIALSRVKLLNGDIHLIAGNHDHCHPVHSKTNLEKRARLEKLYLDAGFKSVATQDEMIIGLRRVLLHHLPYAGKDSDHDGYTERYTQYRPVDEGQWLLCGHVHNVWKHKRRMINVGCDVWNYRPVSSVTIAALIDELEGK